MSVRPMALANRWYSGNPQDLRTSIAAYLAQAKAGEGLGRPVALVAPHAGHMWSGATAAAAYRVAMHQGYQRVFILCPNHRVQVQGIVADESSSFATPLGPLDVDLELIKSWEAQGFIQFSALAHQEEHAIEIQLPFVAEILGKVKIVPLIVGAISDGDARGFAKLLRQALRADDLVIISTDLLHFGLDFGFLPFEAKLENIEAYDARSIAAIARLDGDAFAEFAKEHPHAACGLAPLRVLSYLFPSPRFVAHQLAYSNSAQQTGDSSSSVSYVSMAITKAF